MATYGRGQTLGSGINPESFKQDYSGFARAAEIQAQGLANLGGQIAGSIEKYGEMKKEQKKVDAYNKASAKSIEAAITLGDSYGIKGARETLSPFLSAVNDPSLSPIEKAALLDEGKAMIPNVFGRFDKSQALAIEQAQINAARNTGGRSVNLQQGEIIETINGKQYKVPVIFDPATGTRTRPDGSIVGAPVSAAGISSALNIPTSPSIGNVRLQANAINNAAALPVDNVFTDDPSLLPQLDTGVANAGTPLLPMEGAQPDVVAQVPLGNAGQEVTSAQVPSYAVPLEDKKTEVRALTKEEVKAKNLPDGDYVGRFVDGVLTSTPTVVPPRPDDVGAARQKALDAPNLGYLDVASTSAKKLASLNAALDLLNSKAVQTGTFADYKTQARKLFGQDVSNEEQFNALVGTLAMEALDLTKGSISNMEQKYFTEVLAPNINKSVEGNKKILEFRIGLAKRDVEIGKKVSEMFAKNASPLEIQQEVSKIVERNPLDKTIPSSEASATGSGSEEIYKKYLGQ